MRSMFGLYCLMTDSIMANEWWWYLQKLKCTQYSICVRGKQSKTGNSKEIPLALQKPDNLTNSGLATSSYLGTKKRCCPRLNCLLFSNKHLLVFTIKTSWIASKSRFEQETGGKIHVPKILLFFLTCGRDIQVSWFLRLWLYCTKFLNLFWYSFS